MGFLIEWFDTAKSVILSPSETLREESRTNGFGFPLKFMIFSIFMAGVLNTFAVGIRAMNNPFSAFEPMTLGTYFAGALIGGPIALIIVAAVTHIFAYIVGARKGFGNTLAAIEYGTAVAPLVALLNIGAVFIPFVGVLSALVGIWALQIDYRGLQHFHDISSFRAGMAIVLPILLLFALSVGSMILLWGSVLLM